MCMAYLKVRSVLKTGVKYAFVPCGKCEECRKLEQSSWYFRLSSELQECVKKGWFVCFGTLTYNDACLPRFLPAHFKDSSDYVAKPCFRKSDVRNWIVDIRRDLFDVGVTGLKYMVCSEYGETTRRPHYHFVMSFPPIEGVQNSVQFVHSLVVKYWHYGFVCPAHYLGGTSSKGRSIPPFQVSGFGFGVARYCAKYCSKDLAFYDDLPFGLLTHSKLVRDCLPFHVQSRSLGLSALSSMTDSDKMSALKNGMQLLGSDKFVPLPRYFKNKILFDPLYIVDLETGRRLVRRKCTDFMLDNASEIYKLFKDSYSLMFKSMASPDYWTSILGGSSRFNSVLVADKVSRFLSFYSSDDIASYYLSYFGQNVRLDLPPVDAWLSHYFDFGDDVDLSNSKMFRSELDDFLNDVLSYFKFVNKHKLMVEQKLVNAVSDFHHNLNEVA